VGPVHETVASLRFSGDDLDADEITRLLGVTPSRAERKGQTIRGPRSGRERIARTGSWLLRVDHRSSGDLNAQIKELLELATDDTSVWRPLSKRYKPDVFCGVFLETLNEGFTLEAETLALLAERGLFIGFDIYGQRHSIRDHLRRLFGQGW